MYSKKSFSTSRFALRYELKNLQEQEKYDRYQIKSGTCTNPTIGFKKKRICVKFRTKKKQVRKAIHIRIRIKVHVVLLEGRIVLKKSYSKEKKYGSSCIRL